MRSPRPGLGCLSVSKSAATLAGGVSMNVSAWSSDISRDSSCRRSSSSPAQTRSRNEALSLGEQLSAASSNLSTCFHRSGVIRLTFSDRPVQPRLCFAPFPLDCAGGHAQHHGNLFVSQPGEELHLNDLALPRV